ncbi:hypothetical protein evm_003061 [Chilo suppressalis]|nr:hypothetical protein evm_003061 [Chilo suppressalis]
MLCPEGAIISNNKMAKQEVQQKKTNKIPGEGTDNLELPSFRKPKTWKKSITNFFRQQLRSTKSNDGDRPSGSKESFENNNINREQKWQSLGKVFRRQSFVEHWNKEQTNLHGECSSQSKKQAVRKVLSNYFGKSQKSVSEVNKNSSNGVNLN